MSRGETNQDDAKLAAKIVNAMKEVDAATATRNEKAVAAGRLLIEAQKRHPTERAFEEFLHLAGGIQIRRARDLIALALGRKDFEQHQIENAAAQQRHRDKLKARRSRERRKRRPYRSRNRSPIQSRSPPKGSRNQNRPIIRHYVMPQCRRPTSESLSMHAGPICRSSIFQIWKRPKNFSATY
jgi:hypothetical protein